MMDAMNVDASVDDVKGNAAISAEVSASVSTSSASVSGSTGSSGQTEFGITGTIKTDLSIKESIHIGPWIKMDCGSDCPANLIPTLDASSVPVTANTLNAIKSGVSVTATPEITFHAGIIFNTKVNVGTSGVCLKLSPKEVKLTVTGDGTNAKSTLVDTSAIDWVDRLSYDIGTSLKSTISTMFNTQSVMVRAISLAIESGMESAMNDHAMTKEECAW